MPGLTRKTHNKSSDAGSPSSPWRRKVARGASTKKKNITFKAGMYMKTNKNMTICPHQKAKVFA